LMRGQRILAFDEAAALREAAAASERIQEAVAEELPLLDRALPGITEQLRSRLSM